jgi:hypothetical protein
MLICAVKFLYVLCSLVSRPAGMLRNCGPVTNIEFIRFVLVYTI